jgi:dienelactone hydrolase
MKMNLILLALSASQAFGADAPAPSGAPLQSSASEAVFKVEDGGTGPYKALLVSNSGLASHTIFRPEDLSVFGGEKKLPVIAWGNGGCANSPRAFQNFLSEVASHGFLVIAIGPTQIGSQPERGGGFGGGGTKSSQLLDAIDWAAAQNKDEKSAYYKKIDTSKIAVIGQSCGGLQAMEVSTDDRITTTVICNSGILNTSGSPGAPGGAAAGAGPSRGRGGGGMPGMPAVEKGQLEKLHAPILYLLGGSSDIAYPNGTDDFKRIEKVPVFMANMDVGHGGTYSRPHGGEFAPVAVAWFKWQLKGDAEASKMFTGEPAGLAQDKNWKVEKKNIP